MQSLFARLFPIPNALALSSVGVDFSDTTLRVLGLRQSIHGLVPSVYEEISLPDGCVVDGKIIDESAFVALLKKARTTHGYTRVRVAIPESQIYSATVAIDSAAKDDIRNSIELQLEDIIPLDNSETIFDYEILSETDTVIAVHVVAMPKIVAQTYSRIFESAGCMPLAFEMDSQATVRAVLSPKDTRSVLVVDIGSEQTVITIAVSGSALYTTTLDFGGNTLTGALMREKQIDLAQAHQELHVGLSISRKETFPIIASALSVLRDEIDRRYVFWHDHKNDIVPFSSIEEIYLCGGYGATEGVADYLSASLKLPVTVANPWKNCASFEDVIPVIPHQEAQSYVTAIGLALGDFLYD